MQFLFYRDNYFYFPFIDSGIIVRNEMDNLLLASAYHGDIDALRYAMDHGANIDTKDDSGYTALHWDCFKGVVGDLNNRYEIAKLLIESGADVNSAMSEYGPSIISSACSAGNFEIVKILVENGADVNDDRDGSSPLIEAVRTGDMDAIRFLIEHGAKPNKIDAAGETALSTALSYERFEIVNYLKNFC